LSTYRSIWTKQGTGGAHNNLLSDNEYLEIRRIKHTLYLGAPVNF